MSRESIIRLDILKEVCRAKGWVQGNGKPSPGELGAAIDRKTNYCSDLLNGTRSFGEDIARHIEEKLGLPKWHLDGGAGWPFPQIDRSRFDRLESWQQTEIQGLVRAKIKEFEADNAANAKAA